MPMPDLEDITEQHVEKKSSPPPILRRRRNVHILSQRIDTPDSGNHSDYIIMNQALQTGNTTPSTPIKQLPFSPSQFLNSLSPETSWPCASTPKGSSPGPLTTPQPTGFRRSQNGTISYDIYATWALSIKSIYQYRFTLFCLRYSAKSLAR